MIEPAVSAISRACLFGFITLMKTRLITTQAILAALCLHDHEQTQIRGGFGKKLKAEDVRVYRTEWLARVAKRREEADSLVIARLARGPEIQVDEELEEAIDGSACNHHSNLPLIYEDISKRADPFLSSGGGE